jgi:serine 3-dehydrogenase
MDINGQRVLITGASSGIGLACAERFAELGAHLVLIARRKSRLEDLADRLSSQHKIEVHIDTLDVRERSAVEKWVSELSSPWDGIDVLVNNAGLARGLSPLHKGSVEDWEEMIDTNVKGLLYITRVVVKKMVERGTGHVINIGSIAGHEVYAGGSVYCASKHAVAAINRGLAIDTLGTGVRVSSVDPGLVETEFSVVRFHGDQERADGVYTGMQPLTGADVADAVAYCATRPPHANVREMILMPSAQAAATQVHRKP